MTNCLGKLTNVLAVMLALPATTAIVAGLLACGSARSSSRSHNPSEETTHAARPHAAAPGSYLHGDEDTDKDDEGKPPGSRDQSELVAINHGSDPADTRAITALVHHYYTAATAGNGTMGCALLLASLATAVHRSGPNGQGGGGCAASLSQLFAQEHQHFAAEETGTMVVTGVHVDGVSAIATLGFRREPESDILAQREGHAWKIDSLFDSTLP